MRTFDFKGNQIRFWILFITCMTSCINSVTILRVILPALSARRSWKSVQWNYEKYLMAIWAHEKQKHKFSMSCSSSSSSSSSSHSSSPSSHFYHDITAWHLWKIYVLSKSNCILQVESLNLNSFSKPWISKMKHSFSFRSSTSFLSPLLLILSLHLSLLSLFILFSGLQSFLINLLVIWKFF